MIKYCVDEQCDGDIGGLNKALSQTATQTVPQDRCKSDRRQETGVRHSLNWERSRHQGELYSQLRMEDVSTTTSHTEYPKERDTASSTMIISVTCVLCVSLEHSKGKSRQGKSRQGYHSTAVKYGCELDRQRPIHSRADHRQTINLFLVSSLL